MNPPLRDTEDRDALREAVFDGTIDIMIDRPWTSKGGKVLGTIELKADMPQKASEMSVALPGLAQVSGKHALFFTFHSDTKEKSLCKLIDFVFE